MSRNTLLLIVMLQGSMPILAASLQGNVIDVTKRQGVGGIKVILLDKKGQKVAEKVTNSAGMYNFKDLQMGKYTVRLEPTGYVPNPHEIPNLPVDKDLEQAPETKLWPPQATKEEYLNGGANIARAAMGMDAKKEYAALWRDLRPGQLPADAKFYVVQGIQNADARAKTTFPPFNPYLDADPEKLVKLHAHFKQAVEGKERIPSKSLIADHQIKDPVLADIVVFELNNSGKSVFDAQQFIGEYKFEMKGSASIKAVVNWLKEKKSSSPP